MKLIAGLRSNLQIKLVAVVVVAFGIELLLSIAILITSVEKLGHMSIERQLNEERLILEQRFDQVAADLQQSAELIANHTLINAGLANEDAALIQQELTMITAAVNSGFAWVVDLRGEVLGRSVSQPEQELSLADILAENRSLIPDEPVLRMIIQDSSYVILAVVPVLDAQRRLLGLVLSAQVLDGQALGWLNFFRDTLALAFFDADSALPGINANEDNGLPHLDQAETEALRLHDAELEKIRSGEVLYRYNAPVRGTPHALLYQPLRFDDQIAGYYVIAIDEHEPRAVQNNVLMISLATVFVVLLLTGSLITASLRYFVTRPLQVINQAAYQLGTGQLSARVEPTSTDEIGQLVATFNEMAAHIESRTQELNALNHLLEAKVLERTEQIERQSAWLEAIVCSANEAIVVTNEEGNIRLINEAAVDALNVHEDAAVESSLTELIFVHTQQQLTLPTVIDETRKELEINGRYYSCSITAIRPEQTEIHGYVCILSDVTSLHRLNELKSQIIRMASHDLRSPLTALRLQQHLLKQKATHLTDDQHDLLYRMEHNISDMQRMIDDLLNVEYIEYQAQGKRSEVALDTLVISGIDLVSAQAQLKNQRIETEIAGIIPPVCGDSVRILEAVRNYLTNAIKYTPSGGRIAVCVSGDAAQVFVEVKDTGIGIDAQDLDHVFEPRFRARTALDTQELGDGIGLSLVKAIIEDHGGRVWVKSQPGSGSTFGFSLPLDQSCLLQEPGETGS